MPRVRRAVQDHAAVREVGGVMDDWCYDIHEELAARDRAERAAVTAAVLRALELAAELGVVRVWGVVEVRMAETEAQIRKETYVERFD